MKDSMKIIKIRIQTTMPMQFSIHCLGSHKSFWRKSDWDNLVKKPNRAFPYKAIPIKNIAGAGPPHMVIFVPCENLYEYPPHKNSPPRNASEMPTLDLATGSIPIWPPSSGSGYTTAGKLLFLRPTASQRRDHSKLPCRRDDRMRLRPARSHEADHPDPVG